MLTTNGFAVKKEVVLPPPGKIRQKLAINDSRKRDIISWRESIEDILSGKSDRFLVIAGPCSIHNEEAAEEYARRLKRLADSVSDKIFLVMRAYFHKPRTCVGWKGMINDPFMDGSCDIASGLAMSRKILRSISDLGLPSGTEALDNIAHQYIADLVSWVGIGARSTSSSLHRELASGLSAPVGIKNGEQGCEISVVNALKAARHPQAFLGVNLESGLPQAEYTKGNPYAHLVLRGSKSGPNYSREAVSRFRRRLAEADLGNPGMIIDCSHGNSGKQPKRQPLVFKDIVKRRLKGEKDLCGAMLESNLEPGRQELAIPLGSDSLKKGQSVTDACLGWEETESLLLEAYEAL